MIGQNQRASGLSSSQLQAGMVYADHVINGGRSVEYVPFEKTMVDVVPVTKMETITVPKVATDYIALERQIEYQPISRFETVKDVVLTAAYAILGRWNEDYDLRDESRAMALLTTFGVRELGDRTYGTLSEGEKKRVQISRALMTDPELLLLDEPAAGLDLGGREDLLRRFANFSADPAAPATILVTHHIEEIPVGTTHALLLKDGAVAVSGPIDQVITSGHISAVFGTSITVTPESGRYFARATI